MNRIEELRNEIDTIDSGIVDLYRRRMDVAHSIGQYKREHGIPVRVQFTVPVNFRLN